MLTALLRGLVGLSYAVIVVVGAAQVLSRFVLKISLSWSEETIRYTFIWSVFLTAALLTRDRTHIRVDYFGGRFPAPVHHGFELFSDLLVAAFVAVLLVLGAQLVVASATTGSKSPAMELSMAVPYAAFPVGSALMLWFHLQGMWRRWIRRQERSA